MRLSVAVAVVVGCACGRVDFTPRPDDATDALGADDRSGATDAPTDVPGAGIQLVAHAIANFHGNTVTTAPIDTTGATLIVVAECSWNTGAPLPPTDSKGNVWRTDIPPYGANTAPANIRVFYAVSPTTSAAHTFTNPGNDYLAIAVLAVSGTNAVLESQTGGIGSVPASVGMLTPDAQGDLLVAFGCSGESVATAITIDSGFSVVDRILNGSSSLPEDIGSAFLLAPSVAPVTPRWSFTGDGKVAGVLAAFGQL